MEASKSKGKARATPNGKGDSCSDPQLQEGVLDIDYESIDEEQLEMEVPV